MEDLSLLKVVELRDLAKAAGIKGYQSMNKAALLEVLVDLPEEAPPFPEPQSLPDVEGKVYVYDPVNNRYILDEISPIPSTSRRYFDQKATLYTDELSHAPIARAYNLEHTIPITDNYNETGAEDRGQKLGEASGNNVWKDDPPEHGEY